MTIEVPLPRSIKRRNCHITFITQPIKLKLGILLYYDKNIVNFQLVMFRIIVHVSTLCDNYLQCINTYRYLKNNNNRDKFKNNSEIKF